MHNLLIAVSSFLLFNKQRRWRHVPHRLISTWKLSVLWRLPKKCKINAAADKEASDGVGNLHFGM
jgi:hypothetical protein